MVSIFPTKSEENSPAQHFLQQRSKHSAGHTLLGLSGNTCHAWRYCCNHKLGNMKANSVSGVIGNKGLSNGTRPWYYQLHSLGSHTCSIYTYVGDITTLLDRNDTIEVEHKLRTCCTGWTGRQTSLEGMIEQCKQEVLTSTSHIMLVSLPYSSPVAIWRYSLFF